MSGNCLAWSKFCPSKGTILLSVSEPILTNFWSWPEKTWPFSFSVYLPVSMNVWLPDFVVVCLPSYHVILLAMSYATKGSSWSKSNVINRLLNRSVTRLICFNVKTNCFMWNKIFRSKVYCMENVCWANEVHFMEYLNIWTTLLNINTIRIKEKTKRRQKQYQHH